MKKHAKILILALCCALLLSSTVYAASRTRTMEVTYSDIKLVVDGNAVTPKDATGAVVEPFIYEGTTYLPVRAVGEALGKQVSWDGNSKTVYIGEVPGQVTYLLDVCPPYETHYYNAPTTLTVGGTRYTKSFSLETAESSYAYFNLNGQYNSLSFDVGHLDGGSMHSGTFNIYLDGELSKVLEVSPDMLLKHYTIPLSGALQLRIEGTEYYRVYGGDYGFVNAVLS